MKKLLIYSGLFAMLFVVWLVLPMLDNRDKEYENRLIGALTYLEGIIEASYPETQGADLFQSPIIEPGVDPNVWTVRGNVTLHTRDNGVAREQYQAVVRNLCNRYRERRCWDLRKLVVGEQVFVEKQEERQALAPAQDLETPSPGSGQAATLTGPEDAESTSTIIVEDRERSQGATEPRVAAAAEPSLAGANSANRREPSNSEGNAASLAAPPPKPDPAETADGKPLSRQELIRRIQHSLEALGIDPGPVDGQMGSRTEAAIETYQRAQGLSVDGKVSPALLRHLTENLNGSGMVASDDATIRPETTQREEDVVLLVQQGLLRAGYDAGKPDGVMGSRSRKAIKAYQSEHGLPVNGRATLSLLEHIEGQIQAGGKAGEPRLSAKQRATAHSATDMPEGAEPHAATSKADGYRVQFAAFKSGPTAANQEMSRLQVKHNGLLADIPLTVERADLGNGIALYKVQTGPIDAERANTICDVLKQQDQGCIVIKQ